MVNIKNFIIFSLFLCVFPFFLMGQVLIPPIQNYRIFEYQAASNNWDLAVAPEGELYVANGKGLLHYNGEQWTLYQLPNKTIIRSVAWIEEKIYTGSYEEFGFWEKNEFGGLEYTSLTNLIQDHEFTSEEFWQILPFGDAIMFRSFSGIYMYQENQISIVEPRFVVNHMVVWEDMIVVAGGQNGLSYIKDKELLPVIDSEILNTKIVVDMEPTPTGLLIGTKLHGAYLLTEGSLEPLVEEINKELKQHQLNQVLLLDNGKLAFGTIKNGIYIFDPEDNTFHYLNREVGLQNNTVLALEQFEKQLWIGLDNGIDRLQTDNPLTYYTDYTGVVGTVYDMALHRGTLYLGSNTGIYYFEGEKLRFVEGSQGHIWDLEVIAGDLFCGHNTGTFILDKGNLKPISEISGGYQIAKAPGANSLYLQGTYTGLARYHKDEQGQWSVAAIQGISFPIKYLSFENPTTLWVAHPYKGLYRITLSDDYRSVVQKQEFGPESIPNIYNIKLFKIKNQIVLFSEGVWYKYDPIVGKIIVFEEFQDYNYKELVHFDDDNYWFIDNEGAKELLITNLKKDYFILEDSQLGKRLVPASQNIIKLNDSIYFFTLSDGFSKLNLAQLRRHLQNVELTAPKFVRFKDQEKIYSLGEGSFVIPYKRSHNILVEMAASKLIQPRYYYELNGPLKQSGNLDKGVVSFQNLPYGSYKLKAFTVGIDNVRSLPQQLEFEIKPPWYFSTVSFVIYGLMGIWAGFMVRNYNRRKLERKHGLLKEKLEREQEEQLAQLEKEKLAKEIKMKQKELTSTTMSMARKNELILELKNLLLMNKSKFDNQQRYRSFMKKLNSAISDDEDWRHFEVNFKELHNDFFETLLVRYPGLTSKDLKLCAYLKMNLVSKEIAPLMGISTRGVEIHRYRLRKKLELDSEQNISNFLITLK
ncbi:hypothetical protein SAMN04487911_11951 [Arenibacter nanhaiticus]|uniref:Regulatory protein, luxR family n=2 Tax=Arenibacter nanhaiticus TaxID=558155 RepID=A0A1M6IX39_9FLAO|nr:hypothetical protein SAMN04487911_11951 [Arenibacter nanhaiticus]